MATRHDGFSLFILGVGSMSWLAPIVGYFLHIDLLKVGWNFIFFMSVVLMFYLAWRTMKLFLRERMLKKYYPVDHLINLDDKYAA